MVYTRAAAQPSEVISPRGFVGLNKRQKHLQPKLCSQAGGALAPLLP